MTGPLRSVLDVAQALAAAVLGAIAGGGGFGFFAFGRLRLVGFRRAVGLAASGSIRRRFDS